MSAAVSVCACLYRLTVGECFNMSKCVCAGSVGECRFARWADVVQVRCMKEYLSQVMPGIEIDAREAIFTLDKADELLEGEPDMVVDCIDNIVTKVQLIKYCKVTLLYRRLRFRAVFSLAFICIC